MCVLFACLLVDDFLGIERVYFTDTPVTVGFLGFVAGSGGSWCGVAGRGV